MKHCGTQELETERLVLRRLSIDDSEMMFNNWASDRQVTQYLRWNAHRSWGETAETLNEWEKHYDDPAFYQWGITDKHTEVLFGTISLFPAPALKMGWHLTPNALAPPGRSAMRWAASGGIKATPPRHSVPCGTTGLTPWAQTGWPPSTPMRTLPAALFCRRQALSTTMT